jgi:hypothetical protein
LDDDPIVWKNEINKKHGFFRVDLFMMGLLWIAFMGFDNSIFKNNLSLKEILNLISQHNLDQHPIPKKMLDIEKYPDLTIE